MQHEAGSGPTPGWYDDPGGSGRLRHWSGSRWGDELRDRPDQSPDVDPPSATVVVDGPADRILDLLRLQGGRTRAELARETALSISQVERILDQLVQQGRIAHHGILKEFYLSDDPFWRSPMARRTASAPAAGSSSPPSASVRQVDGASYRVSAPPAPMSFGEAVATGMSKGLDFSGRVGRPEYWWFALFVGIGTLITQFLPLPIFLIIGLVLGIPQLAAATRRLHDTNRSGSWLVGLVGVPFALQLLGLFAINSGAFGAGLTLTGIGTLAGGVGGLIMLVLLILPGTADRNQYGDPPTGSRR